MRFVLEALGHAVLEHSRHVITRDRSLDEVDVDVSIVRNGPEHSQDMRFGQAWADSAEPSFQGQPDQLRQVLQSLLFLIQG